MEKVKDALDYELELSSGFGFDILERDATAVEEAENSDHHGNGGDERPCPSQTEDVLDWALQDAGG